MPYTVAVVGTGPDPDNRDTDGYAMAYRHAAAYERLENCSLTACSDIVRENAEAFASRWELPSEHVFEDTIQMIQDVEPDIISVCVPPHVHADVVIECAETGIPAAIHCEKPMAATWGDCKEMVQRCAQQDIQLTFNHQRRFGDPFRKAKQMVDSDRIGDLERIEIGGDNLYDYGSHLFDLCGFFTDQATPLWVLAGIEYTEENVQFGAHNENQAIVQWRYENGVNGLASTGRGSLMSCQLRLVGEDGTIEIGADGTPLRAKTNGQWTSIETSDGIHGPTETVVDAVKQKAAARLPLVSESTVAPTTFIDRAIADVVTSLDDGATPELAAENALQSTEIIFGAWESARSDGRVTLPLEISDNPLESMVESGRLLQSEKQSIVGR
jgi:predicted dehydrogenase